MGHSKKVITKNAIKIYLQLLAWVQQLMFVQMKESLY